MNKKVAFIVTLFLVLAGSATGNVVLWKKYQAANQLATNPDLATKKEVQAITSKISVMMELPSDEDPSIATVLDKEKLKDQQFFTKAENGDKIIIFSKNQQAILYRPSTNKIIEVAPISLSEPENTPQPTEEPKTTPTATPTETPSE